MKKKILIISVIIVAVAIGLLALVACGNDNETTSETAEESVDIVAEIPYINRFTCDYYTADDEKIEDRATVFEPGDEIRVKTNFILLPDAYAEGKGKFTVKFILSGDFAGKILSANSSATSDKDLTATFTADDKNPKNCEIETRINVNYCAGSFKIAYAYDDEEYAEACELPLNNDKTLLYTYDNATDGYIVSKDPSKSKWLDSIDKVSLPDLYDGKSITHIGSRAFYGCTRLTSITIPDSVKSIDWEAFYGCTRLTSITIPDSLQSIESSAFHCCSSLQNITMPDSLQSIGGSVFKGCSSLTSITIPNSVTSIESYTFKDCSSLTSITISNKLKSVEWDAFIGCSCLISVNINDIEAWCNIDFSSYASNPMNNGAELRLNGELVQNLVIPSVVTEIKDYSFCGCRSLTSVSIPDNITSIGDSAFNGCRSLASVTIPNGVNSIKEAAFYNCISLTEIAIPCSVNEIKENTFSGCNSLTNITIPDSVTRIGWGAFENCSNLKSISIPNKVEYIEGYVFSGCSSLTSVTLPTNAIDISTNAFSGCGSLTSITIPKIWYLGDKAFSGCSNLTNIVYGGTKADWKSIASDRGKINKKGKVTVKCTDGELKFTFNN